MPTARPTLSRLPAVLLAGLLAVPLLAGCDDAPARDAGSSGSSSASPGDDASGDGSDGVGQGLLDGLDVCSLVTPDLVRRAVGQTGDPTSRVLGRVGGYDGVTDQCGFGITFDSFTLTVDVGLAPAAPKDLARITDAKRPPRGAPSVDGLADGARVYESQAFSGVVFVKGSTFVRLQTSRRQDDASRLDGVVTVAREVAAKVPGEPPASDDQTRGKCADLDQDAVTGVLGAEAAVSRSIAVATSAECSFATGTGEAAKTLTVAVYGNQQTGDFFEAQQDPGASEKIPGVTVGNAFTVPGAAYLVADDGQAVSVGGTFGPTGAAAATKPLPPTKELATLLTSAAGLLE